MPNGFWLPWLVVWLFHAVARLVDLSFFHSFFLFIPNTDATKWQRTNKAACPHPPTDKALAASAFSCAYALYCPLSLTHSLSQSVSQSVSHSLSLSCVSIFFPVLSVTLSGCLTGW